NTVAIVLGSAPVLGVRGAFTPGAANSPSGIDVAADIAAGSIVDDGGLTAVSTSPVDLAPGLRDAGQRFDNAPTRAVVAGDLDGDGDLDLVIGNAGQPTTIWFNDGAGNFTNSGQALGSDSTQALALGDVDGDGDLDLITASDD